MRFRHRVNPHGGVIDRFIIFLTVIVLFSIVFGGLAQLWTNQPFISKWLANSPWTYFDIFSFELLLIFLGGTWYMAGGMRK
jgi:hypothetical protein